MELLRDFQPEIKIIDKPFRVKKFLLSEKSELINQEGSIEVKIVLPESIKVNYNEKYSERSKNWQKAEIDGELLWVLLEE